DRFRQTDAVILFDVRYHDRLFRFELVQSELCHDPTGERIHKTTAENVIADFRNGDICRRRGQHRDFRVLRDGAPSIVADEVKSPRIAATLSCETNFRKMVAVSPALDPLSSTIRSIGCPRTPPALLISPTARSAPCLLDTP